MTSFPLLRANSSTVMTRMSTTLAPQLRDALHELGVTAGHSLADDPLEMSLVAGFHRDELRLAAAVRPAHVEPVRMPLTVLGTTVGDAHAPPGQVLLHVPGFAGGVAVSASSFLLHAAHLRAVKSSAAVPMPSRRIASALTKALAVSPQDGGRGFLWHAMRQLVAWQADCAGASRLTQVSSTLRSHVHLSPCFPYHVPNGPSTTQREFFDTSPATVELFGSFQHGRKYLTRRGVAICVGVRSDARPAGAGKRGDAAGAEDDPVLYFHVAGRNGATIAPEWLALPAIDVGGYPLQPGGPAARLDDVLLQPEPLTRYCHTVEADNIDRTAWLCRGLFAAEPGETLLRRRLEPAAKGDSAGGGGACVVVGVGCDTRDPSRLELMCRPSNPNPSVRGVESCVTDWLLYGTTAFNQDFETLT